MPPGASTLKTLAKYRLSPNAVLTIAKGSVLDFTGTSTVAAAPKKQKVSPHYSAIVNAANEGCLGGGGVDGAISDAGGPNLAKDRHELPILETDDEFREVRCFTGSAVITGPGEYGKLHTSHVIHAVGPNYWDFQDDVEEGHEQLSGAYRKSLELAQENNIRSVGFSLLSAGIFKARVPLKTVLVIGVITIRDWAAAMHKAATAAEEENKEAANVVEDVTLCAFLPKECKALIEICNRLLVPEPFEEEDDEGEEEEEGMEETDAEPVKKKKSLSSKESMHAKPASEDEPMQETKAKAECDEPMKEEAKKAAVAEESKGDEPMREEKAEEGVEMTVAAAEAIKAEATERQSSAENEGGNATKEVHV